MNNPMTRRSMVQSAGLGAITLLLPRSLAQPPPASAPSPQDAIAALLDVLRRDLSDPQSPFTLLVEIRLKPDARGAFARIARLAAEGTRAEVGVLQYEFHEDAAAPGNVWIIEQWRGLHDLQQHLSAPYTQTALGELAALAEAPPTMRVLQPICPPAVRPAPQLAGYYPFVVGDVEAIVISDGQIVIDDPYATVGLNLSQAEFDALLQRSFASTQRIVSQCNALLVRLGRELVLIDAGAGDLMGPNLGRLTRNLASAGVNPRDVTAIVLTHAHPDHLGGLLDASGAVAFPNARLFLTRAEHAFWTADAPDLSAQKLPPEFPPEFKQAMIQAARQRLAAYAARTELLNAGDTVLGKLEFVDTAGHTPGHAAIFMDGGSPERSLLVTGDAVGHHLLGVERVEAAAVFDMDPAGAVRARRGLLEQAAAKRLRLLSYHAAWPGLGRVRRDGEAFAWVFEPMQWALA